MATETLLMDEFFVQVDGSDLALDYIRVLEEAIVEDDLSQPAMFSLRFHDQDLQLIDGNQFKVGSEITLGATDSKDKRKTILVGEVTALEAEFDQFHTAFVVRGYDKSHRLYRGRKTQAFLKKSDGDIARTIAKAAKLQADIESGGEAHEYVMQDSQTDMEFLRARAARNGYSIVVDGSKLKFRTAEKSPPQATAQDLGQNLLSFNVRMTAVAQPNKVEVRSWDRKAKKAIVGSAVSPTKTSSIGYGKTGGDTAKQSFGSSQTVVVTDQPVQTQGEATRLAQAILDDMANDYLIAEGFCTGEPSLKAGTTVEVKGVGTRFGGKYFVTATRHIYTADEGYRTTFCVNGRNPMGILATVSNERPRHAIDGVVPAIVTNINDPDSLGRVKLKFPWLNEQQESDWARLVQPGAGKQRGMFAAPEVNDEVLVAFEQGDINRPYVIGGLWNTKDTPPTKALNDGKVQLRTIKTRAGHVIEFGEDEGSEKGYIQLKTAGGCLLDISDTDQGIKVKSQKHTIHLDDQGQAVKIQSGGSLELKGAGQKLSFTQGGIELSGPGGKLMVASAGIELAANANLTMKGNANVDIQANALMNVKSSAILNIQGTLVKIN